MALNDPERDAKRRAQLSAAEIMRGNLDELTKVMREIMSLVAKRCCPRVHVSLTQLAKANMVKPNAKVPTSEQTDVTRWSVGVRNARKPLNGKSFFPSLHMV